MDYAELASTYWWRRTSQIRVWGPRGLQAMTQGMYALLSEDIGIRLASDQPIVNRGVLPGHPDRDRGRRGPGGGRIGGRGFRGLSR